MQLACWNGLTQTSIHAQAILVCSLPCRQQRMCLTCGPPQCGSLPDSYWTLVLQGTGDEAASFCFNMLDAGRRGLVQQDSFVAATNSCATLALHDQPDCVQDTNWAEATAAGVLLLLNPCAQTHQSCTLQARCKQTVQPLAHCTCTE